MREFLRKAGRKLEELDHAYAEKITDMYTGGGKRYGQFESGARMFGAAFLGGVPISKRYLRGEEGAPNAVIALNAAVRYGAPAIGITLAGKGIMDLTAAYNQQTAGTLEP